MPRLIALAAILAAAWVAAPSPAAAQAGDGLPSECVLAKADAYTVSRERQGFDGIVTADQLREFEAQCDAEEGRAGALTITPENLLIHQAAAAGRNLFALPAVQRLYTGLWDQGNSGAAQTLPEGWHHSASNGRLALTQVCEGATGGNGCQVHSTVIVDLDGGSAIACERWQDNSVWWTFSPTSRFEDPDGRWCPDEISEIPPEVLAYWLPAAYTAPVPATRGKR